MPFYGYVYLWTYQDVVSTKFATIIINKVSLYGELVSEFGCTLCNLNSHWLCTLDYEAIS